MAGPPTHIVMVKKKDSKAPATRVGVGWLNDKGWMGLKLDPCVVLTDRDDIYLNVYPNRDRQDVKRSREESGHAAPRIYNDYDDDVPF